MNPKFIYIWHYNICFITIIMCVWHSSEETAHLCLENVCSYREIARLEGIVWETHNWWTAKSYKTLPGYNDSTSSLLTTLPWTVYNWVWHISAVHNTCMRSWITIVIPTYNSYWFPMPYSYKLDTIPCLQLFHWPLLFAGSTGNHLDTTQHAP